jgi:hypothetical protein
MAPVLERKSIGWDQKIVLEGELLIWKTKNQARIKVQSNLRIRFAANQSKLIPRKLRPGPSSEVGLSPQLSYQGDLFSKPFYLPL